MGVQVRHGEDERLRARAMGSTYTWVASAIANQSGWSMQLQIKVHSPSKLTMSSCGHRRNWYRTRVMHACVHIVIRAHCMRVRGVGGGSVPRGQFQCNAE